MTVRIERPEYGGTFVGLDEAGAGHSARFVLPGELVELPSLRVLEASGERVAPRCRHFGVCGGCDYQHSSDAEQIRIKKEILLETLQAAGLTGLPDVVVHAGEPWEYRNRVRFRVEAVDGAFHAGYNRRGGREFLPIAECPISSRLLLRAAEALLKLADGKEPGRRWLASTAEVEFFASNDEKTLQMTVLTRDGRIEGFAEFCGALAAMVPELVGAGVLAASAGYGAKERATWGTGGLVQEVRDRRYWVSRGGFFQVNRVLVEEMVELVTAGRRGALAWDLYAGVGLFSRVLAGSFELVVGVEVGEPAASDLARAPKKTEHLQAVTMETVAFLRAAAVQRERPDLIVMDPPRAGIGAEVCGLLERIGAAEIVYVSCDVVTLARDLFLLVDSGYRVAEVHLIDMFPQTFHLETVVFLSKTMV
ncbi:class I SAM-dependent RNA methyltransferase [Granulicella sibirica]|uniref:RNA methyltransferase, TrmA family n=1 Tax=Granulicella sibirica TaxID=2479048 RepID=A0A4Q0T3Q5_9BACT|nr:class I SAM-dependent RNA methyltransferase [Granulicella sibirica]RXH57927.1 RNA methyltransferase, TrmA family [Granulicella sibirica]